MLTMDSTQLAGTGLIIPIVIAAIGVVIFYLIIRAGVFAGMRDYQKWIEKRRAVEVQTPPRTPLA
jgi:hypothetical protein